MWGGCVWVRVCVSGYGWVCLGMGGCVWVQVGVLYLSTGECVYVVVGMSG